MKQYYVTRLFFILALPATIFANTNKQTCQVHYASKEVTSAALQNMYTSSQQHTPFSWSNLGIFNARIVQAACTKYPGEQISIPRDTTSELSITPTQHGGLYLFSADFIKSAYGGLIQYPTRVTTLCNTSDSSDLSDFKDEPGQVIKAIYRHIQKPASQEPVVWTREDQPARINKKRASIYAGLGLLVGSGCYYAASYLNKMIQK